MITAINSNTLSLTRNNSSIVGKPPAVKREKQPAVLDDGIPMYILEWEKEDYAEKKSCGCNELKAVVEWAEPQFKKPCSDGCNSNMQYVSFRNPSLPSIPSRTFKNSVSNLTFKKIPVPQGTGDWHKQCPPPNHNFWTKVLVDQWFTQNDLGTISGDTETEFKIEIRAFRRHFFAFWKNWKAQLLLLQWKTTGNVPWGDVKNTNTGSIITTGAIQYSNAGQETKNKNHIMDVWLPLHASAPYYGGQSTPFTAIVTGNPAPIVYFSSVTGVAMGTVKIPFWFWSWISFQVQSCTSVYP